MRESERRAILEALQSIERESCWPRKRCRTLRVEAIDATEQDESIEHQQCLLTVRFYSLSEASPRELAAKDALSADVARESILDVVNVAAYSLWPTVSIGPAVAHRRTWTEPSWIPSTIPVSDCEQRIRRTADRWDTVPRRRRNGNSSNIKFLL